jgi:hypothetical protein
MGSNTPSISLAMHVTCGDSKKKFNCTVDEMRGRIETLFCLSGQDFFLQTWDVDDKDWVDLDDVAILNGETRCKLNVIVR